MVFHNLPYHGASHYQMVDGVEEELNEIVRNTTDDNRDAPRVYEEFIARHSGSLLHANHYLLMTAKRNLIQFYTYATPTSDILDLETVRRKLEHCQHFYSVLTKVGKTTVQRLPFLRIGSRPHPFLNQALMRLDEG